MAEQRPRHGPLQVRVDYWFDRLHDSKRAQAYRLLVPSLRRILQSYLVYYNPWAAASIAAGSTTRSTSRAMASSTALPPKEIHFASP